MLGVRAGEGRLVATVAGLFGAIEAGRGFGEIGVDTLFVHRFGAGYLPYLFIGLGGLSLVASLVYGAALGRARRGPLFVGLLVAIAIVLVLERLAVATGSPAPLPIAWLSVYAAGAIATTMAWTLAGSVFDARQAKRVFPICTSAAIAGSFAGTLVSGPVARVFGAEALMVVQAALLAGAASLVAVVSESPGGARLRATTVARPILAELGAGLEYVVRSPLMRLVALAYVLFAILLFSVSFPFLQAMATAFPNEGDLATTLGLLSAGVTATSFVVSLVIANRLYARFGIATAAAVLPVVYLLGFGLWIVQFSVATAAFVRFVQQVAQRGVSNAAWSAFYSVVPVERRAQVLAFNDGVPGQVGTMLSGLLLLAGGTLLAANQVFWLGALTAAICTVIVLAIRRRYGASIVSTLRAGLAEQVLEGGPGLAALSRDAQVGRELVAALAAPEPSVRTMAASLLGRIGGRDAADALTAALEDADAVVRAAALDGLVHARPSNPDPVVGLLADAEPPVRAAAVRALCAIDPAEVVRHADALVTDASPAVRGEMAVALVRAGEEDRPHALLASLVDAPTEEERIAGLEAIASLGGHAPSPRIPERLWDLSPRVRAAAVRALAAIRPSEDEDPAADVATQTDRLLIEKLEDDDTDVRRAAAAALRARSTPASGLVEVLATGSERAQDAALIAMEGHGPAVRDAVADWVLEQVERATDLRRQQAALNAVASRANGANEADGADGSVDYLVALLRTRSSAIEGRLLAALAVLGAHEASGLIRRCLHSSDPEVRAQAMEALDSIGDRRLARAIVGLIEDEPSTNGLDADAALARLASDRDRWIRAFALRAEADRLAARWRAIREQGERDPDPLVWAALAPLHEDGGSSMPETGRTLRDIDRILFLRRVPLFAGLAPEDLQRIAGSATERFYPGGEALMREGELGDELVVIVEGSVRIVRAQPDGTQREVRHYTAGDHIGELAVLRERPRAATVIADEPGVRGLVIAGSGLTSILRERPEAAMAMLATLAERISYQQ